MRTKRRDSDAFSKWGFETAQPLKPVTAPFLFFSIESKVPIVCSITLHLFRFVGFSGYAVTIVFCKDLG
jgi:hypothetical protein